MSDATPTPTNDDSDSSSSTPAPIEYRTRRGNCGCVLAILAVLAVIAGIGTCVWNSASEGWPNSIAEAECANLVDYYEGRTSKNAFGMENKVTKFTGLAEVKRSSSELRCRAFGKMENGGSMAWELYYKYSGDSRERGMQLP